MSDEEPFEESYNGLVEEMTSLAFPTLKRTITDIMEDDLYHLPSNTSNSSFQQQQQQQQQQYLFNDAAVSAAAAAVSAAPYIDDYQQMLQPQQQIQAQQFQLQQVQQQHYQQQYQGNIIPEQLYAKSPFADYANPDSQFGATAFNQTTSFNGTFPTSNRRRFTILDSHSNEKPMKDEDYYLFNTDVQPSHLVSKNENACLPQDDYVTFDSPLYVPQQTQQFPIPGFENDYLLMSGVEDFDEDFEDPISDDDDEDNYFHDDFEEMLMNNDFNNNISSNDYFKSQEDQSQAQTQQGLVQGLAVEQPASQYPQHIDQINQISPQESLFISQSSIASSSSEQIEQIPVTGSSGYDSYDLFSSIPEEGNKEEDLNLTQDTSPDEDEDFEYSGKHNHFEATSHVNNAEISATNPNHQCDLINPTTKEPCNKQFSRSYDLIRHQETIHATKKKIFRCVICEGRLNGGAGNGKQKPFQEVMHYLDTLKSSMVCLVTMQLI